MNKVNSLGPNSIINDYGDLVGLNGKPLIPQPPTAPKPLTWTQSTSKNVGKYLITGIAEGYDELPGMSVKEKLESLGLDPDTISEKLAEMASKKFEAGVAAMYKKFPFLQPFQAMSVAFSKLGKKIAEKAHEALEQGPQQFIRDNSRFFVTNVLPPAALTLGVFVGLPLAIKYTYHLGKHGIGRPKLAVRERRSGFLPTMQRKIQALWNQVMGIVPSVVPAPIFNADLSRRVDEFSQAIRCTIKNGGFFQNILFYGPGGVGKTMIGEKIAQDADVNFILMSGGTLAQYMGRNEHVTELNKLFDEAEKSSKPTIIFIDEAEGLCLDRNDQTIPQDPKRIDLLNAFLNRTGTQSKKIILILATNCMDKFDEAVLSRMDHKVEVQLPGQPERVRIINLYLPILFDEETIKTVFTKQVVEDIAKKTSGLPGRTLFKMLNAMLTKKTSSEKNQLTDKMLQQTVTDFVTQELKCKKGAAKSWISHDEKQTSKPTMVRG